jgi:putative sigma-54 modulation protein
MQITISGHQVIVTPALRDYAESKLGRIVRHFEHLHDAAVVLSVEKLFQKA